MPLRLVLAVLFLLMSPAVVRAAPPWGAPLGAAPSAPSIDAPVVGGELLSWSAGPGGDAPRSRVLAPIGTSGFPMTSRRVGSLSGAPQRFGVSTALYVRRQSHDRARGLVRLGLSVGTRGGALGTPRWFGSWRLAGEPVLAVDPNGSAVLAWSSGTQLWVVTRTAAGRYRRPEVLRSTGRFAALSVAVAASGRWVAAWELSTSTGRRIEVRGGTTTRGVTETTRAVGPSRDTKDTVAVIGAGARGVVAWATQSDDGTQAVRASVRRGAAGTWTPSRALDLAAAPGMPPGRVDAVIAADGRATIAWSGLATGDRLVVRSATQDDGGAFGAPSDLGSAGALQDLATGPRGTLVAVWTGSDADGGSRAGVAAAVRPAGGQWLAPEVVADEQLGALDAGSAAFLPDGRPIVAWVGIAGDAEQVRVSVRDIVAPPAAR